MNKEEKTKVFPLLKEFPNGVVKMQRVTFKGEVVPMLRQGAPVAMIQLPSSKVTTIPSKTIIPSSGRSLLIQKTPQTSPEQSSTSSAVGLTKKIIALEAIQPKSREENAAIVRLSQALNMTNHKPKGFVQIPPGNSKVTSSRIPPNTNVVILKDGQAVSVRKAFAPQLSNRTPVSPFVVRAQPVTPLAASKQYVRYYPAKLQKIAPSSVVLAKPATTLSASQPQPAARTQTLSAPRPQALQAARTQTIPASQPPTLPATRPAIHPAVKPDLSKEDPVKQYLSFKEVSSHDEVRPKQIAYKHFGGVEDYLYGATKKYMETRNAVSPQLLEEDKSTSQGGTSKDEPKVEERKLPSSEEPKVSKRKPETITLVDDGEEQEFEQEEKGKEESRQEEDEEAEEETTNVDQEELMVPEEDRNLLVNLIEWKDSIGQLPGLEDLKFKINSHNLLEIEPIETRCSSPEEPSSKKNQASEEWLKCSYCGAYGMRVEFHNGRFCGPPCEEEYAAKKQLARESRRMRRDRKYKLKLLLKKLLVQRASLEAHTLAGARDVVDMEIFRVRMQLEQLRLELTTPINYDKPEKPHRQAAFLAWVEDKAAPAHLFKEPWPLTKNPFKVGWKLEAIDPQHPSLICVVTVVETCGYRVKLRFDGYGANHDFWVNANSAEIFQPGWCERTDHKLTPPRNWEGSFNWTIYLEKLNAVGAPRHAFTHPQEKTLMPSGFRVGMKLEAVDKKNTRLICVATIADVIENRILVHIDGSPDKYDYWAENNSPYIHPAGWCAENGHQLQCPGDQRYFRWDTYSLETKSFMAPARAFKIRPPHEFKKGMKVEAVDKRNPDRIRLATIIDTEPHQIRIKFDGWPVHYAYWIDDDSPDFHPVGWCTRTGHPLAELPSPASMMRIGDCPTPGCSGAGHAFRARKDHSTELGCPYSPSNYQFDDLVAERFTSTAEYQSVKEVSHSKGTKPRTLLRRRTRLIDAKKPSLKRKQPEPAGPPSKKSNKETKEVSEEEKEDDIAAARMAKLRKQVITMMSGLPTNPRAWTVEEVHHFIDKMMGNDKGKVFEDNMVDGESLLMIAEDDLTEYLNFKVGPAITIHKSIQVLRKQALQCAKH